MKNIHEQEKDLDVDNKEYPAIAECKLKIKPY